MDIIKVRDLLGQLIHEFDDSGKPFVPSPEWTVSEDKEKGTWLIKAGDTTIMETICGEEQADDYRRFRNRATMFWMYLCEKTRHGYADDF